MSEGERYAAFVGMFTVIVLVIGIYTKGISLMLSDVRACQCPQEIGE